MSDLDTNVAERMSTDYEPAVDMDMDMDNDMFARWANLLERRTGLVLPFARKPFLVTNLRVRMRELNVSSFEDYYDNVLEGPHAAVEWATLVDRLTVHETRFFRHTPSLDLIRNELIPELLASQAVRSLDIWSMGCATGEEAYSLAMVCRAALEDAGSEAYLGVTATDVSQPSVAIARGGIYHQSRMHEIPNQYRERFCVRNDDDRFEIDPELRRRVAFAVLNLLDAADAPMRNLHLIYCQNVLIYFPREKRRSLLETVVPYLMEGGYLILGPGEVTGWEHPELERVGGRRTLAYRRVARGNSS